MKRRTVSADDLETMAFAAHAPIEPPGPEGGWATAVINGREYRARVGAVVPCCSTVAANSDDELFACIHSATHEWLDLTGRWSPVCKAHGVGSGVPADRLRPLTRQETP